MSGKCFKGRLCPPYPRHLACDTLWINLCCSQQARADSVACNRGSLVGQRSKTYLSLQLSLQIPACMTFKHADEKSANVIYAAAAVHSLLAHPLPPSSPRCASAADSLCSNSRQDGATAVSMHCVANIFSGNDSSDALSPLPPAPCAEDVRATHPSQHSASACVEGNVDDAAASGCGLHCADGAPFDVMVDEMARSQPSALDLCCDLRHKSVTRECSSDHELGCDDQKSNACKKPGASVVKRQRSPDFRPRSPDFDVKPRLDASFSQIAHDQEDVHCRQRFLMQALMHIPPPKLVPQCDFTRILTDQAPRSQYRDIPHHMRTTNHWGQRKLLLSEVEFLTMFIQDLRSRSPPPNRIIVVYAGAAAGNHIPYLFDLFDNKSGDLQVCMIVDDCGVAAARLCDDYAVCPV